MRIPSLTPTEMRKERDEYTNWFINARIQREQAEIARKLVESQPEPEPVLFVAQPPAGKKRRKCKERAPLFDKKTKQARFDEEGGNCQWCRLPIIGPWHAHHIIPRSQGGQSTPENLMVLHVECHMEPSIFEALHPGITIPSHFRRGLLGKFVA